MQQMFRDWGEPQIFGIPDGTTTEFLRSAGLTLRENLPRGSPESVKRFLTRRDGTLMGDIPAPATPVLGPGRYVQFDAVAVVP